jgi:hypothetical protein
MPRLQYNSLPVESRSYRIVPNRPPINIIRCPPRFVYEKPNIDIGEMHSPTELWQDVESEPDETMEELADKEWESDMKQIQSFFPHIQSKEDCLFVSFDSIPDYMDKTCDIKFLHNYYDGTQLHVKYWEALIEKTTSIEMGCGLMDCFLETCKRPFWHRLQKRVDKYERRGYTMEWSSESYQKQVMDHVHTRDVYWDSE